MSGKDQGFRLSELIKLTADELREASEQAKDSEKVLAFQGCELEVAVSMKVEAGAGIRFYVLSAGSKAASAETSRVKLTFTSVPGKDLQMLEELED